MEELTRKLIDPDDPTYKISNDDWGVSGCPP